MPSGGDPRRAPTHHREAARIQIVRLRQAIADRRGDTDGFIALESALVPGRENRVAVAERLLRAGRPDAALDWIRRETAPGSQVISVGYLALTPEAATQDDAAWSSWSRFFPWEDWRGGRPPVIDEALAPPLKAWAAGGPDRAARARSLFALDGAPWNEERVLDRYELLYEAGLAAEAERDRGRARGVDEPEPSGFHPAFGQPMVSDHRRILATGLGRLRGKLKYRPIVFELMPESFTLYDLQRAVEAISGVRLHKQNFRRMVERTGLVEGLGRTRTETGGRPAELFRYKRESAGSPSAIGFSLPGLREQ